jgi:hypothetical protein
MHQIYLYNSLSGTGRDFLAAQLSDDPNFYPLSVRKRNGNEGYEVAHPLRYFGIDNWFRNKIFEITDEDKAKIDEFFSTKSLIIPLICSDLHSVNLPRLTGIQTNFTTSFGPLFYTSMIMNEGMDTYQNTSDLLSSIEEIDPTQQCTQLQRIKERGQYYSFERRSLELKFTDPLDFAKNSYRDYIFVGHRKLDNFKHFQLDNLFNNPKDNVKEFCNLVGRESLIDYRKIEEFHADRILTLEKTFNKSYKNYVSENWREELVEWVRNKCY